jgi:hypothetical protein
MPHKGKILYPDTCGAPGKATSQGGSSTGKAATLNKTGRETPMTKTIGTPRDKGVNR